MKKYDDYTSSDTDGCGWSHKVVEFYESGKTKSEGNCVYGKMEGQWVWYYESGKVKEEGNWVDDKREGKWVWYGPNGKLMDEDIYENGACVEMCEGDE